MTSDEDLDKWLQELNKKAQEEVQKNLDIEAELKRVKEQAEKEGEQ